jgi:CRISPR-associated endonuclease/helicase Cas3
VRDLAVYFIEPSSNGSLYVVGHDCETRQVATIRLDWITRAQLLNESYAEPDNFERQPYLVGAWGIMRRSMDEAPVDVALSFMPEMIPAVKERLGQATRRFTVTEDGRFVVRLQVADWRDMLPWIRSWGTKVEVLEPAAFRDAVAVEVSRLASMYAQPAAIAP